MKSSIVRRPIANNIIFIGRALMELNLKDAAIIFGSHHCVGQSFSSKSFARARRPLKNQVFLGSSVVSVGEIPA